MKFSPKNIIETISIAAIIGGLILVAYQIEQSTQIARAQIRSDYTSRWISIETNRQNESLSKTLAKSLNNPDALTLAELIQLDAYYMGVIDQMYSAALQLLSGLRRGNQKDLNETFIQAAETYFGNKFAQAWWLEYKKLWVVEIDLNIVIGMEKAINSVAPNSTNNYYSSIKQNLKTKD